MSVTAPTSSQAASVHAPAVVRFQSALCLAMLLILAGIFVGVDLLARSKTVASVFNRRMMSFALEHHDKFGPSDQLLDKMDYLWLVRLPQADYSRGGVYLFGSSVAISSLEDWALNPSLAALIHNYGYNGAKPDGAAQFIRFLIRYQGLLAAGPDKSLIVLGLVYGDIYDTLGRPNFFEESILRSGLYNYDPAAGITPLEINSAHRFLNWEELRCRSFLMATRQFIQPTGSDSNPRQYRALCIRRAGSDWSIGLSYQLDQEQRLLRDLNGVGVHVVGVLLPEGTWNDGIPAHDQYMIRIRKVFAGESVPLIDCSRLVPDGGFADMSHPNLEGEPAIHHAIMKIALDFLHQHGQLPADLSDLQSTH